MGRIANLNDSPIKCHVRGKYELVNNYHAINTTESNRARLTKALQDYPLAREILPSSQTAHIQLPLFTVNQVSAIDKIDIQVSDLDYADAIMDKEPTFGGEAVINPEIIEPSGLDLPTIIHTTAAEAIDLSVYSDDIRPYIKSIFIDKYPQVVSLHSLDAGNLSLTLAIHS